MNLNIRIIQLRKKHNITQTELADRCKTTQQTIAKIEQGIVDPRLSTLQRIAEALNCELTDLFYTKKSFEDDVNHLAKKLKINLDKISSNDLNDICWEESQIPQFHPFWQHYKIKNNKFTLDK